MQKSCIDKGEIRAEQEEQDQREQKIPKIVSKFIKMSEYKKVGKLHFDNTGINSRENKKKMW